MILKSWAMIWGIVNHCAIVNWLRIVKLPRRSVLVRQGPLGDHWRPEPLAQVPRLVSVATPAEPRGEKKKIVQILGGEKLLKVVEKCQWNIFKRPERG